LAVDWDAAAAASDASGQTYGNERERLQVGYTYVAFYSSTSDIVHLSKAAGKNDAKTPINPCSIRA
jgi:hypothetical protein